MAKSKERQRQLARAKWERQQARRTSAAIRRRRISLVVGVVAGLIVTALLVWLVIHIVNEEGQDDPNPVVPTDSFSTELQTPESNTLPASGAPTESGATNPNTTTPKSKSPAKPDRSTRGNQ